MPLSFGVVCCTEIDNQNFKQYVNMVVVKTMLKRCWEHSVNMLSKHHRSNPKTYREGSQEQNLICVLTPRPSMAQATA